MFTIKPNIMKKIILSIVICCIANFSFGQTNKAKTSFATYNNKEHKIKLQYPKTWELTDTVSGTVFYIFTPTSDDDRFNENFNMSMEDMTGVNMSFKEFVETNVAGIKDGTTIGDFKQTSAKYFKWNGVQAYEIVYTGKLTDVDFRLGWTQRFLFHNGKAYILTYSADAEKKDPFLPAAKQVMNSVKFY